MRYPLEAPKTMRKLIVYLTNLILKIQYPIKDNIWKGRRWNRDKSDYVDLSG